MQIKDKKEKITSTAPSLQQTLHQTLLGFQFALHWTTLHRDIVRLIDKILWEPEFKINCDHYSSFEHLFVIWWRRWSLRGSWSALAPQLIRIVAAFETINFVPDQIDLHLNEVLCESAHAVKKGLPVLGPSGRDLLGDDLVESAAGDADEEGGLGVEVAAGDELAQHHLREVEQWKSHLMERCYFGTLSQSISSRNINGPNYETADYFRFPAIEFSVSYVCMRFRLQSHGTWQKEMKSESYASPVTLCLPRNLVFGRTSLCGSSMVTAYLWKWETSCAIFMKALAILCKWEN